jgi:hypothetical protein
MNAFPTAMAFFLFTISSCCLTALRFSFVSLLRITGTAVAAAVAIAATAGTSPTAAVADPPIAAAAALIPPIPAENRSTVAVRALTAAGELALLVPA